MIINLFRDFWPSVTFYDPEINFFENICSRAFWGLLLKKIEIWLLFEICDQRWPLVTSRQSLKLDLLWPLSTFNQKANVKSVILMNYLPL